MFVVDLPAPVGSIFVVGLLKKVVIADSGDGISPDHLAHIFEPFFTTKGNGTGLGLPITRGIIEEHGGLITVESEPKKGARFTILLPLLKAS